MALSWMLRLLGLRSAGREAIKGGGGQEPVNWVSVLTTYDVVESRIAAARLEDEGILTRIRQEAASSAYPVSVGMLGRIDVMVPADDEVRARQVLEATLGPAPADEEEWAQDDSAGAEE